MFRVLWLLLPLTILTACAVWAADTEPSSAPADQTLADQAQGVLKTHCFQCHRKMEFFTKRIVPGQADQSKVYKKAAAGHNPRARNGPCNKDEVKILKDWINSLAPTTTSSPS